MASRFGKDTTSMLRLVLEVLYFRVIDPQADVVLQQLEHHDSSSAPTSPADKKMEKAFGLFREALAACK